MLIHTTLALLLGLVVLTGIGLGPGLLFLQRRSGNLLLALAIAPALALALFDILGFTLVLFVGPVRVWVWPATAALLAISLGLTLWASRRGWMAAGGAIAGASSGWRRFLPWLAWYAVVLVLLVSPLLVLGIQYTAFRANASDAFFYMSLAETARTAGWDLVEKGMDFTAANFSNLQRLAEASPTALFTARFIARPTSLNHPTAMAWLAQLGGAPIYQFYYAYHMLLLAAAAPAIVAIGRLLRMRRSWLALTAAVVVLGFWARQVVEMDASYELSTVPVLALVVFAWILVEGRRNRSAAPLAVLMAIAVAALSTIYFPVLAVFVAGMLVLGAISLFRRRFKTYLFTYAAVGALTFLILLVTGQLVFQMRNMLVGPGVLEMQRDNTPATVQTLLNDGLAALIALPVRTLYGGSFPTLATIGSLALQVGGVALLLVLVYWLWRGGGAIAGASGGAIAGASGGAIAGASGGAIAGASGGAIAGGWRRLDAARRVLIAAAAGGAIVFGLLLLDGNAKAAGKAFTYAYPYFLLLLATAAGDIAAGLRSPARRRLVNYLVAGWLALALIAGALLPYTPDAGGVFRRGRANKAAHDFDLAPIVAVLRSQPGALLVNVPREDSWVFPYYVMQVLGGDPASYQSGLVIDNSIDYQNLWTHRLQAAPDYVLTATAHDYMAGDGSAIPSADLVVETSDLRLYRVTDPDPAFFLAQTDAAQAAEARDRKPFPQWSP